MGKDKKKGDSSGGVDRQGVGASSHSLPHAEEAELGGRTKGKSKNKFRVAPGGGDACPSLGPATEPPAATSAEVVVGAKRKREPSSTLQDLVAAKKKGKAVAGSDDAAAEVKPPPAAVAVQSNWARLQQVDYPPPPLFDGPRR
jgi:hypothetical protein